jgi:sulfatase maturation enzyme AslB (radical SAM superfamily)|tara:strand:+ start:97 stop:399 length:303 start_codon:yes stop_codon:yes gene_type:complete
MDKYRSSAEKVLKGIHPDLKAKEALVRANFASLERETFFNEAYGELLVQYFTEWLKTDPHEVKTREFIYNSALSLGDVKQKLINYEIYGKNVPYIEDNEE